jgi:hypothetical protein
MLFSMVNTRNFAATTDDRHVDNFQVFEKELMFTIVNENFCAEGKQTQINARCRVGT